MSELDDYPQGVSEDDRPIPPEVSKKRAEIAEKRLRYKGLIWDSSVMNYVYHPELDQRSPEEKAKYDLRHL
ncbi:MAG: hypothetical protein K2I79_00970 [Clostridia bacterium]|nr:hypothetical protein [Clostridia bacterium]